MIYCLVPRELAATLHEPLRRHFSDDPFTEVVVERRVDERRSAPERRAVGEAEPSAERRRIRNPEGRRVADRRATHVTVQAPPLPRRLRGYADRLTFLERIVPTTEEAEDVDTARLVTRIQAGQREGFTDLYVRYFDRVYGYLHLLLRDPHDAEDITQLVFLNTLESIGDYERRRQPFRAWLFTLVRNRALTYLRDQRRLQLAEPAELERRRDERNVQEGLDDLAWIADRELLMFVERLPLQQRQVLVLRYMLDLRSNEIAQVIGSTPDAVRQMHSRAIRQVRERLAAVGRRAERGERFPSYSGIVQARVLRRRRFALWEGRRPERQRAVAR
jgi:RNA polymerase sigma-70 factor (ECF subfamily)